MRILVVNWKDLAHPNAGGAEVYTQRITRQWVNQGHDVTWFAAAVAGHPADELDQGVRIVRRGSRWTVYRQAKRFYREAGRGAFDLVIDEVNTRPFLACRWATDTRTATLIHQLCREIWWHEMPFPVAFVGRFWLERRWLRACSASTVLTVSESSRSSLQAYGIADAKVVPEGVDFVSRQTDVGREQAFTIVFVGRLASNKRPRHALRAFEQVRHQIPDAQLWMIGDGPQADTLRRRKVPGVTFFGRTSETDKQRLVARAHVLVATSVREGWGLVVDEAAAVGTPTVAYDVPGLRDSVTAAGGTLVRPTPKDLARALCERAALFVASAAEEGWRGGAQDWATTAQRVLAACLAECPAEPNEVTRAAEHA